MTLSASVGHPIHIFGANTAVGTTEEDVWDAGGVKTDLTAASKLSCVSASANDTAAGTGGTGARTIRIHGLDGDLNMITEDVVMAGATPVVTTKDFIFVTSAWVQTCGTSSQVGIITITAVTGSSVQAKILPDNKRALSSHFMVPKNYALCITDIWASASKIDGPSIAIKLKLPDSCAAWQTAGYVHLYIESFVTMRYGINTEFSAGSIIKLTSKGVTTTDVSCGYVGNLRAVL